MRARNGGLSVVKLKWQPSSASGTGNITRIHACVDKAPLSLFLIRMSAVLRRRRWRRREGMGSKFILFTARNIKASDDTSDQRECKKIKILKIHFSLRSVEMQDGKP